MNKINKISTGKTLALLILFIFYLVLFYLILHYSFMFNPIQWIITKKSLIQILMLLFIFRKIVITIFYDFIPLFVRRGLSLFYSCL